MVGRLNRALWIAAGLLFLLLPLFPVPQWVGAADPGPDWTPYLQSWGIGLGLAAAIGTLLGWLWRDTPVRRWSWPAARDSLTVWGLALVVLGGSVWIMYGALAVNPHSVDEMAQLFQARTYLSGRLAAPPPETPEFFLFTHTWITSDGWVSQFPPAHAVLLAVGMVLGLEQFVNPVLGAISVVLIYRVAEGMYSRRVALLSAALWAGAAWVLFMSATYMNHASAVVFALGALALLWGRRTLTRGRALGGGALIGLLAATRPLDAVAVAIPIVAWFLLERRWRIAGLMMLGGAPVLAALFYVNWRSYGNPLTFGYSVLYEAQHDLGFHTDVWGLDFTPAVALSNLTAAVRRLHIYLYEWPIPALLPIGGWALFARHRSRADLLLAFAVLSAPVLYFFYWHSGFYPGPRFYYIIAPFLVIGTARAFIWAWDGMQTWHLARIRWPVALVGAMAVVVVWGIVGVFPHRFVAYRTGLASLKRHPERQLAERGVRQALVIIPVSWGVRIITDLWTLGVKPGLVEHAYRVLDTCDLYEIVLDARRRRLGHAAIRAHIEERLAATPRPTPLLRDWPDPTVRLRPRRLPEACERELLRDREGFGVYGNIGWRNPIGLHSGLVFARDLFERNPALFDQYPGWEVWRYAPPAGRPDAKPILTRIHRADGP